MATISLNAKHINQMSLILKDVQYSVLSYQTELLNLSAQLLIIPNSICKVDEVINSIHTSAKVQEQKSASIETFIKNNDDFVANVIKTDDEVAAYITQSQADFYKAYAYLKPDYQNDWIKIFGIQLIPIRQLWKKIWSSVWEFFNGPEVEMKPLELIPLPDTDTPESEEEQSPEPILPYGGIGALTARNPELSDEDYIRLAEESELASYRIVRSNVRSMETSEYMRDLIKEHEASGVAKLEAYVDAEGHLTIGYGHKLENGDDQYDLEQFGVINLYKDTITEEMAELILSKDLKKVEGMLQDRLEELNHAVSQREFDALISLVFNVGQYASIMPLDEEAKTSKAADTYEWFLNEGYRDKDYTMAILGDMTSGDLEGIKKRRLDEIDILFLDGQTLEQIYHYDEDLTRYGDIWHKIPEKYKAKVYITVYS